jgi:hypothetical protein
MFEIANYGRMKKPVAWASEKFLNFNGEERAAGTVPSSCTVASAFADHGCLLCWYPLCCSLCSWHC